MILVKRADHVENVRLFLMATVSYRKVFKWRVMVKFAFWKDYFGQTAESKLKEGEIYVKRPTSQPPLPNCTLSEVWW